MDWSTLLTVLPTALSASLYAMMHITFLATTSRRRAPPLPAARPLVSVLKPLAGVDDDLGENLESFGDLDYPAYEILFGVASPDDPAVAVVRAFLAAHPSLSAELVFTSPPRSALANPKVAQLIALAERARGSVLVVSDANVRVPRTYLSALVGALLRPGVGLVSSLIVGVGERTLGAAIDNAQLGAHVAPAVVTAHRWRLRPITVGKSMAMRRADLVKVGGFESVAAVLAEDDALGQRFDAMGYGVELCFDPVENHCAGASLARSLARHARWAKIRRSLSPAAFSLELFLSPLIVASLVALFSPSRLSFRLWAFSLCLSWVGAFLSLQRLRARGALLLAALEPLRAAAMFFCFCAGWVSRKVSWRGHAFTLAAGSRLVPAPGGRGAGREPPEEAGAMRLPGGSW
jgi:ceramide glucosyltransferase